MGESNPVVLEKTRMSSTLNSADRVFKVLNGQEITYALIRNEKIWNSEPDIDLLVSAQDRAGLLSCFAECGYLHFRLAKTGRDDFFTAWDPETKRQRLFHVAYQLHYGFMKGLHDGIENECLNRRLKENEVPVLSLADQIRSLVLHCVLDKKSFEKYEQVLVQDLAGRLGDQPVELPGIGSVKGREITKAKMTEWLKLAGTIRRALLRESMSREFPGILIRAAKVFAYKCIQKKPARGFSVAFIGIDGAGKSSVIQGVFDAFKSWPFEPAVIYMGDNKYFLPGIRALQDFKDGLKGKHEALSSIFLLLSTCDKWMRSIWGCFLRLQGRIVIYDRWFHDLLVNPEIRPGSWKYTVKKGLFAASPNPDLVIFLKVNDQTAVKRKGEHEASAAAFIQQFYEESLRLKNVPFIILDANQSLSHVVENAMGVIWEKMIRR